ncbi:MAG: hypothetical protein ED859_17815 [Desulfuromonadales bacterium]|nr:MAG: hypothetical protein ED859_17815 [Desulfuromonadales bacterium]
MCGSKHHGEHLCSLKSEGDLLTYRPLRVVCGHCGVRSDHPRNVCDPMALPTMGWFTECSDIFD